MKKQILIIEDEALIAEDIRTMVEELGYHAIRTISRSDSAIDYLSFHTPDLVLCDINIKGELDGIEVAQKIRKKKQVPFVYLTSLSDSETISRASTTMPYGYIIKPFDEHDIHSAIEIALSKFQNELEQLTITKDKLDQISSACLTDKEYEIVRKMIEGKTSEEIQTQFDITNNTLKFHSKNIYLKFQLSNRTELMQVLLIHFTRFVPRN